MTLVQLDVSTIRKPPPHLPGPVSELAFIRLDRLRVDYRYQRRILRTGERQIEKIAASFQWSHFSPVIVAPIEGDLYVIIDGQHRATAALAAGHECAPCMITKLDARGQALAFAALNGSVTRMSALALFHARRGAGDPEAVALDKLCLAGGVRILGYPLSAKMMKPGDCTCPAHMARARARFGDDVLLKACTALAKSGQKDIRGLVNPTMVHALCILFRDVPLALDRVTATFAHVDLRAIYEKALRDTFGSPDEIAQAFRAALESLARRMKRIGA